LGYMAKLSFWIGKNINEHHEQFVISENMRLLYDLQVCYAELCGLPPPTFSLLIVVTSRYAFISGIVSSLTVTVGQKC